MLEITVPDWGEWDESKEEFINHKGATLQLEHSLISISKWEATHKKPFLGSDEKKPYEQLDYIRCMTLTRNVDPEIFRHLSAEQIKRIWDYVNTPQTATTFREDEGKGHVQKTITSEVIYYQLFSCGIDLECQKWHLSRLLTLIRVFGEKNQNPKKMPKKAQYAQQARLNAERRKRLGTTG